MTQPPPSTTSKTPPGFWVMHLLLPLVLLGGLAVLFEKTDLDFRLTDPFFDFATGKWPYKDSWWAGALIHDAGKWLIVLIGIATAVLFGLTFVKPSVATWRMPSLYFLIALTAGTGITGICKANSSRHAPWGVDRYGGKAPHIGWFQHLPKGVKKGKCFPAGHASGGFALMAGYFALRERNRRWAYLALCAGLLLGCIFAFGQQARGAHFASHNVYTIAICWFGSLAIYQLLFRGKLRESGGANHRSSS